MKSEKNNNLRKKLLACRDALTSAEQTEKSENIIASLAEVPEVQQACSLFIYVNFRSEVQTISFIKKCLKENKKVTVPVTRMVEKKLKAIRINDPESDLQPGYCGIPEPTVELQQTMEIEPASVDMVIIPGSVFDQSGGRLGYGGGFYDRFLTEAAPRAIRVGLAFELQLVDRVPMEPHDQYMDILVTEQHLYDCRRIRHEKDSSVSR